MSTMVEDAQRYIESYMLNCTGDDDFPPFLAVRAKDGQLVIGSMFMPEEPDLKDRLGDTMAAICIMHQATEAVFASVCWMVQCADKKQAESIAPSQHPDRIECVTLTSLKPGGETTAWMTNVIRENNMVGVGIWEPMNDAQIIGRFADAIRFGLYLGQKLPPQFSAMAREVELMSDDPLATTKILDAISSSIRELRMRNRSAFNN